MRLHDRVAALLLAGLAFLSLSSRCDALQVTTFDDGLPQQGDAFAGPVTNEGEAGYHDGLYGPTRFELPAWPSPDGLSPLYITDVEVLGVEVEFVTRYGLENASAESIANVEVGRYVTGKIMYPPEFPWLYIGEPLASYTQALTVYGATGPLTSFDGVFDGAAYFDKPAGSSGYWGGGASDGLPTTLNLFVPYWNRQWWAGKVNADGHRMVPFVYDNRGLWWFYDNPDEPLPSGHWYAWEDRIASYMEEPPEGVRYFFDRDGAGPIPEESLVVLYPEPGLPIVILPEPFAPARSRERLTPEPIGSGRVLIDGSASHPPPPFAGPSLAR